MAMAWHGMAWHGMAWYGMVWYGMVVCRYVCVYLRTYLLLGQHAGPPGSWTV